MAPRRPPRHLARATVEVAIFDWHFFCIFGQLLNPNPKPSEFHYCVAFFVHCRLGYYSSGRVRALLFSLQTNQLLGEIFELLK